MQSTRLLVEPGEMQSGFLKEFEKLDIEIEIKELEASDYVIDSGIGFKRLTLDELLKFIFGDRELLGQIRNLSGLYERPVLIIEGEDPFYPGQTINPGPLQNFLKTIAISLRVPVVFTLNEAETARVISSIVMAEQGNLRLTE